jgi:hypothetical protein
MLISAVTQGRRVISISFNCPRITAIFASVFSNGGHSIRVLLVGGSSRFQNDRSVVPVRDDQREDRGSGSGEKSPKSSPFALASAPFVAFGLVTMSGVLSHHAVYTCRGRDDSSYYLFALLSFLAIFGGFFLLATIFGFFPGSPLPHLDLF